MNPTIIEICRNPADTTQITGVRIRWPSDEIVWVPASVIALIRDLPPFHGRLADLLP